MLASVEFAGGGISPWAKVGSLTAGQRRLVEVARAVAGQSRLVLPDEPASGRQGRDPRRGGHRSARRERRRHRPAIVNQLIPVIRQVTASGVGVLLIEQFATVALSLATGAYVMEGSFLRYSGTAAELKERPELLHSAYLHRPVIPVGTCDGLRSAVLT